MRIAVTGPDGFVAWHTRCAALARWGHDLVGLGRSDLDDVDRLAHSLTAVDAVIHLAAINRSDDDSKILAENERLARNLAAAIERVARPVVHGNSIHSSDDTAFGLSKRRTSEILHLACSRSGVPFVDVILPNLFGEHGRPNYNSVVATFCHLLARGEVPSVFDDRELPLLHVQHAASLLLDQACHPEEGVVRVAGRPTLISEVKDRLTEISHDYESARLPDLGDDFTRDLFNTYRSHAFPERFPIHLGVHRDERGGLVDAVQVRGGQGQVFYSTTGPGKTRGQHFHLRKVERFVVDMPTLWAHSITNIGEGDLLTLFWADEMFNPDRPDTYPQEVL